MEAEYIAKKEKKRKEEEEEKEEKEEEKEKKQKQVCRWVFTQTVTRRKNKNWASPSFGQYDNRISRRLSFIYFT